LQARWERLSQTWDDAQRQQFEKDFLEGLESDLRMAIGAIESMYSKVEQARSECADRGGLWS
ncbi:MAG: hypothetical protein KC983_10360, partial [Phycisphaerales bacterium]|nr:hypothetical protein [Phycisphaerales bacterium]